MKQIEVDIKCNGCGLCIVNSPYLQENAEGNAQPVEGKAIKDSDLEGLKNIVNKCPENALKIIESGIATKKGKAGVCEVIADLKKKCDLLAVEEIKSSDIKMNMKDYTVTIPISEKQYCRDYTSESSAKSAAKDEFNQLCYSEAAYRPLIKKVFVEYRVNVLGPYYNCVDEVDSAYYKYNERVRKYLADAYVEVCDLLGDSKLPESWKNFSGYLQETDWHIQAIKKFDGRSTSSGIIAKLNDLPHTSLSDYVSGMDFDYIEEYVGESIFGNPKYKNKWYFSGFSDAAKTFLDDLIWAIGHMSSDIEEDAAISINSALKAFEEEIKKEFSAKIQELEGYIT